MARAAVFCARYWLLRPIALLLAATHKNYHSRLVDGRAEMETQKGELGWWWLSFVDPEKPDGARFLGVAIVEGYGVASAAIRAHELGLNPGGEVKAVELKGEGVPAVEFCNTLLDMAAIKRAGLA